MAPVLRARFVDITTLLLEAIVHAANPDRMPAGGVCAAFRCAAGPELARAAAFEASCPPGEARITPGFLLPAARVIHAVAPIWRGGREGEADRLAAAYAASVALAQQHGLRSLALPAISTGIDGYPRQEATEIAVRTVRDTSDCSCLKRVIFACFDRDVLDEYRRAGVMAV